MAPVLRTTLSTWSTGTNRNSACGSTKVRMSQGHATRSTLTLARVTHFMASSIPLHLNPIGDKARLWSVLRPMRNRPFPCMLDRSVRRQRSAKAFHRRQCLHPLPPSAEARVFRIHTLAFLGQSEAVRTRQEVKVRKGKVGTQQILLPVSQLALDDLKPDVDLRKRVRDHFLVGRDAQLGKHAPFVGDVIDHVGI